MQRRMKLDNEQIKGIISELKERGYGDVGMRDISYVVLCRFFKDHNLAFLSLFKDTPDLPYELYDKSDKVLAIESFLEENYAEEKVIVNATEKEKDESISFDELKQGLIDDMNSLIALRDQVNEDGVPVLEPKEMATVVGRISDIRVKLTEKFGATQKEDNHRVVVISKYNKICPHCGREY